MMSPVSLLLLFAGSICLGRGMRRCRLPFLWITVFWLLFAVFWFFI